MKMVVLRKKEKKTELILCIGTEIMGPTNENKLVLVSKFAKRGKLLFTGTSQKPEPNFLSRRHWYFLTEDTLLLMGRFGRTRSRKTRKYKFLFCSYIPTIYFCRNLNPFFWSKGTLLE